MIITGCAIHPVYGNPCCRTCREHGNPHPFDRAEAAWQARKDAERV